MMTAVMAPLPLKGTSGGRATFGNGEMSCVIALDSWERMGKPAHVSITVEPGTEPYFNRP